MSCLRFKVCPKAGSFHPAALATRPACGLKTWSTRPGAATIPTIEYDAATGQWKAVDPKYQSYATQLQNLQANFQYNYNVLNPAGPGTPNSPTQDTSAVIPPDPQYAANNLTLPFSQISGRTSNIRPDTSASMDLNAFYQSPAGNSSSAEIQRILKLIAERDKLLSARQQGVTNNPITTASNMNSTTTPTTTPSSTTPAQTTAASQTMSSTGTSMNIPISAKDFYSQFKPILQQDVENTVKNELEKQYEDNPVLGDDPCEECY